MSRHLRTRNVDNQKRLKVSIVEADDPCEPTTEDLARILDSAQNEPQPASEIPIPNIVVGNPIVDHSKVPGLFKRPHHYIHYHQHCGSGVYTGTIFYDLREHDMNWASINNIDLDLLENLITQFEIEAGRLTHDADCLSVFGLAQATRLVQYVTSEDIAARIYQYWLDRRRVRGKPLIPLFERPPDFDDPSPHVAFRARENTRRICTRNPRKNDAVSFCKVRLLKRDTLNVLHILDQIQKREALKRNRVLLEAEEFDIRLSETAYAHHITSLTERTPQEQTVFNNLKTSLCKSNYELHVKTPKLARPPKKSQPLLRPTSSANIRDLTLPSPTTRAAPVHHRAPAPPHLFDFKFPNLSLSSDEEESEPETESEIAFINMVEKYLRSNSDGKQMLQKRPKRKGADNEQIGYVQARIQRNGQVWFDPVIYDVMLADRLPKPPILPQTQLHPIATKCPAVV